MGAVKKAIVAGFGGAGGAALLGLTTEVPQTSAGWVALVMGALTVGIVTGLATWRARNTGPGIGPNGSEAPRRP